ncbi:MAG TPA: hypothetical protein VFN55_15550 [Solirubrobacteraceae bacterium]|nr:hypothetical protein [Solirubrobacteraceae bacterium]
MHSLRLPGGISLMTVVGVLVLGGCGQASSHGAPALAGVPLVAGTRVLTSVRRCDRGANAYCAVQLVISSGRFADSTAMLHAERDHLKGLGWTIANADTGDEHAADSPHHTLHLVYATAALDLKDLDLGWIQRAPVIARTLSETMFDRAPALSLMLETGSS